MSEGPEFSPHLRVSVIENPDEMPEDLIPDLLTVDDTETFSVSTISTQEQVGEMLDKDKPIPPEKIPDAIILEADLKGFYGLTVLEGLRAREALDNSAIILVGKYTGEKGETYRKDAERLGATYMVRPFPPPELFQKRVIGEVMKRRERLKERKT